jgi:GT2 family glycosyltransferase
LWSKFLKILENLENTGGFGYACNLGAARCKSSIILFLNTDCLLTEGVLDRLCAVFDDDQSIALACPVSNNSPDLTYPMFPGYSYRDMASLFAQVSKFPDENLVLEACTVVGNCLAVRRDFYEQVGGFSSEWGIGYGEETELHMKALSMGLKGVVHVGCYVYHFGGGTFNFQSEIEEPIFPLSAFEN